MFKLKTFKKILYLLVLITTFELSALDSSDIVVVTDGLSDFHEAGNPPGTGCSEPIRYDTDEGDGSSAAVQPVAGGAGDFCSNPSGQLCRDNGTAAKINRIRSMRMSSGVIVMGAAVETPNPALIEFEASVASGTGSIQAAFNKAKNLFRARISSCRQCSASTKTTMTDRIQNTGLIVVASSPAPGSQEAVICGSDGLNNNAAYFAGKVYICRGRIVHSSPASGGSPGEMGNYLFPVLAHELGHALDGITTEIPQAKNPSQTDTRPAPWNNEVLDCLKTLTGESIGSGVKRNETVADLWSYLVMGDIPEADYLTKAITGRGSMCATAGGAGHPLTVNRLMFMRNMKSISDKKCPGNPPTQGFQRCMDMSYL